MFVLKFCMNMKQLFCIHIKTKNWLSLSFDIVISNNAAKDHQRELIGKLAIRVISHGQLIFDFTFDPQSKPMYM